MSERSSSRALRVWAVIGAVAVAGFVGAALFGERGVARHQRLRSELDELERLNAELSRENRRLRSEARALRSDPDYIEHVIRDELGWVRPDEVVLIFPRDGEPSD